MPAETRISHLAILHLQVNTQFVAANGIAIFKGNIGMFERAVIARMLIMIDDVVAIKVFQDFPTEMSFPHIFSGNPKSNWHHDLAAESAG